MQSPLNVKYVGLFSLLLIGLTGCGIWPFMTEDNGRRPVAMGKSDQIAYPWAPHPVHLNEEYGIAYRQAVEGQILNPRAANNVGPVQGPADPKGLQYSLTRYQLHFKTPPYTEWELKDSGSIGGGSKGKSSGKSGKSGGKK